MLTDYIKAAMAETKYEILEDGTYCGRIPLCQGVICFAPDKGACEKKLQSVLEEWVLMGLKLGHELPIIENIDLNKAPKVAAS